MKRAVTEFDEACQVKTRVFHNYNGNVIKAVYRASLVQIVLSLKKGYKKGTSPIKIYGNKHSLDNIQYFEEEKKNQKKKKSCFINTIFGQKGPLF